MIKRGEFHERNFIHKLQVLTLGFNIGSTVFPYEILQLAPNIEKLVVCDGSFKEIFCFDSLNVDEAGLLLQLKVLCLDSLPEFVSIGLENSWIQPLLGNLETLEVIDCYSLKYLVPCTVSFSNLTYLQVQDCNSLLYLFTSSTARSLGQLKRMEIKRCYSIEEIVSKEGDESHENEIIFPQLNCLKLEGLRKLRRFYRGSLLSFPSLEELSVIDCKWMETLCPGTLKADKLVQVQLEESSDAIKLENDLNSTMREAFGKKLKVICWDSLPELVSIGSENSGIVPFLRNLETLQVISCFSSINLVPCTVSFSNLTYLKVKSCKSLLYLFTSSTARSLGQLKTMKIKGCDSIEEIVSSTEEGDESDENEIIFQQLNCLELEGLGKLRRCLCERMESLCAGTVKTDKLLEVTFHWSEGVIPLETDLNSAMQNR
ncbi:hypothetical protein AAZX31_07G060800 [Glycine max]